MTIRTAVGFAVAGALGAATVVLPAEAGSETTPTITAENVDASTHHWTPSTVGVSAGGTVEFSNPGEVPHGIHWVSTPGGVPACEAGVPVGNSASASGTKWKGDCTFATAGTYTFYCTVHGPAMSGTITVSSSGATTMTMTSPATGTTTSGATPGAPGNAGATSSSPGTTPASAAFGAVRVAGRPGGVHGSLTVSQAAAGGTLLVVLRARIGARTRTVGRLTRAYIAAGTQSWTVALSSTAKRALHRKHRLVLAVKLTLTPPGGSPVTVSRPLTLHG